MADYQEIKMAAKVEKNEQMMNAKPEEYLKMLNHA